MWLAALIWLASICCDVVASRLAAAGMACPTRAALHMYPCACMLVLWAAVRGVPATVCSHRHLASGRTPCRLLTLHCPPARSVERVAPGAGQYSAACYRQRIVRQTGAGRVHQCELRFLLLLLFSG